MANGGGKNDNGSQFFLTLGETRELQDKHTMFGRIMGDTIYNLMKMGEADLEDVEGSERPLFPTKVTGAEVLVNPFEDMFRREPRARAVIEEKQGVKKKSKKKGGKVLLSFGAEDGEDGGEAPVLNKEKFNPKLVSANGTSSNAKEINAGSKPAAKPAEKTIRRRSSHSKTPPQPAQPNRELQLPLPRDEEPSRSPSTSPEPEQIGKVSSLLEKTNAQIADLKASMKRNIQTAPAPDTRKKSALEQMIPENATRGRKRKHGANGDTQVDKQALDMLSAFKAKLEQAPKEQNTSKSPLREDADVQDSPKNHDPATAPENIDDEAPLCDLHFISNCQSCQSWDQHNGGDAEAQDDRNEAWMSHALSFEKDRLGKDLSWKKKNEEELVVIDPREKEKGIREEMRARKLKRLGGRGAWDLERDRGRGDERRAGERVG